ncbi:MAG: hypothetical protein ACPLVG_06600 [Pseudothermotoga sp.]
MNRFVLALALLCTSLFAAVSYYFESANLVIKGLETYDSVKITIDQINFTVNAADIRIPWQKNTDALVKLVPMTNGQEKEPITLKINANKDLPPKMTVSIPSYVPAEKLTFPVFLSDDWDEASKLTIRTYLDGRVFDGFKNGSIVIDAFLLHSGEHRLRITCKDSGSNVVDRTYRFTVVSQIPAPPMVNLGKVVSNRTHRAYFMENSELKQVNFKQDLFDRDFYFVCDVDGAENESFPVLNYVNKKLDRVATMNLITLNSGLLASAEYTIFGKLVIPSSETVVLRQNATLKIPQGCEITVKGTLIAEPGTRITGQGRLTIADEGRFAAIGARLDVNLSISGSSISWFSDLDLSKTAFSVTRAAAISFKNVKAKEFELTNAEKVWIYSCEVGKLVIKNVGKFLVTDSKINHLNVSNFSKGRLYATSLYSNDNTILISNFSVVELIDSWISANKCAQVQDYSILRLRSTQINGDVAFNLSGYSILDSFANEISSSTALYAKDSRVRFLKTKILGEVIKVGRSEISNM